MDAAVEQPISKVAKTEEARSSLRDLIASITAEESAAVKPIEAATQQTPTKLGVVLYHHKS